MSGKVVVNRCMSLDGFIAGPGHSMDWGGGRALADFVAPDDVAAVAAATGAMLVGRRTWEVGAQMEAEEPESIDYPFSGPMFLLTHRPLEPPDPKVTILAGDIGEAVGTALEAAGDKNLEILGADVASQCLQRGLVDEILVYVLPVLLGDGIRFSSSGLARTDLEPISSTRSGDATILRFRVRKQISDEFVPVDFQPPTSIVTDQFRLEPLGPQHNEADHAAWMSSIEHIRSTPGFADGKWPPRSGMTLEENLSDLRRHADDFRRRAGFTFTVLDPGDNDVIGCVYLYPSASEKWDVSVHSWVRADRSSLDTPLADAVAHWLASDWPWDRVDRRGR